MEWTHTELEAKEGRDVSHLFDGGIECVVSLDCTCQDQTCAHRRADTQHIVPCSADLP